MSGTAVKYLYPSKYKKKKREKEIRTLMMGILPLLYIIGIIMPQPYKAFGIVIMILSTFMILLPKLNEKKTKNIFVGIIMGTILAYSITPIDKTTAVISGIGHIIAVISIIMSMPIVYSIPPEKYIYIIRKMAEKEKRMKK